MTEHAVGGGLGDCVIRHISAVQSGGCELTIGAQSQPTRLQQLIRERLRYHTNRHTRWLHRSAQVITTLNPYAVNSRLLL